jgi:hypothetical protein
MTNFWKKYKISSVIVLYLLAISMLLYFVVKPLFAKISISTDKMQEIMINQKNKENRLGEIPKLKDQFAFVQKKEEELSDLLSGDKAVGLIEEIEKIAGDSDNKITIEMKEDKTKNAASVKSESAKKEAKEDSIISDLPSENYLEMKINLNGTYNNLVKFIKKVESMESFSDIILISIAPNKDIAEKAGPSGSNNIFIEPAAGQAKEITSQENIKKETKLDSTISIVFYIKK